MNKYLIIIVVCILFFPQFVLGQQQKNTIKTKGYFVFIKMSDFEQTIFLPNKNVCKNYTFKKLTKIKGWLIRGQDTYELFLAKQEAKQYNVLLPRVDENSHTSYSTQIQLGILPVELTYWETSPGKPKEDSGIPFDYKGKRYVINYIDDWDVAIEKIEIIK